MPERHHPWVAAIAVAAAAGLAWHFVRLRHAEDATRTCIARLEQIQAAKEQFALDHDGAEPAGFDVLIPGYLPELPGCPLDGTYTLGGLTNPPTCSVDGHALPTEP